MMYSCISGLKGGLKRTHFMPSNTEIMYLGYWGYLLKSSIYLLTPLNSTYYVYPYIWYSRATAHESTYIIWCIYVRTVLLLPVQLLCTVHKVLYISRDPVTRYPVIYASTCTRTVQCVATYVGMCIYSALMERAHESMYSTTYHMLCTVDTYCIYSVYVLYREYIYVCIPWIMGPSTDIHDTTIYSTCVRTLKEYSTSYLCTYMGRHEVSIYHVFQCYAHEEHGWSTHDVPYLLCIRPLQVLSTR